MTSSRIQQGMTLIELLITLAIAGIVISFAAPDFTRMIAKYKSSTAASDFLSAYKLAKSEAVKRGLPVTLMPVEGVSDTAAWGNGWCVVVGTPVTCTGDILLKHKTSKNVQVKSAEAKRFIFDSQGFVVGKADSLSFCSSIDEGKQIKINTVGQTRQLKKTCS